MTETPRNRDADAPPAHADERLAGRLARWPLELVLGLLVLLCLAFDVQAAPLMWVFEEGLWGWAGYIAVGIVLAQPGLLGLWAVLGPQRAGIQWSRAFVLLVLVWWADLLGTRGGWDPAPIKLHHYLKNANYRYPIDTSESLFMLTVFLGMFLLVQLPAAVARWFWQWRLSHAPASSRHARRQFSLRQVFGWTAFVAVLLGASRYLLRDQTWQLPNQPLLAFMRDVAFDVGFVTGALSPLLLPVISLAGLVMAERRRIAFLVAAIVCAVGGAITSVALVADQNASVRLQDGCFEELGFCGATLAALWIVHACGFRLAPFVTQHDRAAQRPKARSHAERGNEEK